MPYSKNGSDRHRLHLPAASAVIAHSAACRAASAEGIGPQSWEVRPVGPFVIRHCQAIRATEGRVRCQTGCAAEGECSPFWSATWWITPPITAEARHPPS